MKPNAKCKTRSWNHFIQSLAMPAGVLLLCLIAANLLAQTCKVLHHFTDLDQTRGPYGGLVLSGNTLYGTTCGPYPRTNSDLGTVFKVNTDGSGFAVLKKFSGTDGSAPWRVLVLSGETLYGVTREGGVSGHGTVFRINTDGSGFTVLKDFVDMHDGYQPSGRLVLVGSTLYGMTSSGGTSGSGNVFKVNTNGGGFSTVRSFEPGTPDGFNPYGGLANTGTTLFGTTVQGGITNNYDYYGCGTVFRINTDGSSFSVLKRFLGGDDGEHPDAAVVVAGSTLYGITDWFADSRESNYGTIFRINFDGGDFNVLKRFTNPLADGQGPRELILSGNTLYGSTWSGGMFGKGVVFRINTDGSDFAVLKHFSGSDGAAPNGDLVVSGTTIYGTTISGGVANHGLVFALGFPPAISGNPQTQTIEKGSSVCLSLEAEDSQTAWYQWLFNDTNVLSAGTNALLQLTNVQSAQAGIYTAVVTNIFGAVTSAPAMLSVIPVVERRPVPGIKVTGDAGSLLNLDFTDSLNPAPIWATFGSATVTNPPQFYFDLTAPLPPQRFYRVSQTGTPSVLPWLDLHIVPAITLTGNIGDNLRLDYINQFGPTDAWVTLDTITLTNTSQLYFDISAIGQPPRLWRIVPAP